MARKRRPTPSIEVKTNYVHAGIVRKDLNDATKYGAELVGYMTTKRFSKPARKLLDENDIAWAEVPESELKEQEQRELEKKE